MTQPDPSAVDTRPGPERSISRQGLALFAAIAVLIGAVLVLAVGSLAHDRAMTALRGRASASAALHAAVLRSELDKQRALPLVLADDADLETALATRDPRRLQALSRKLEQLGAQTRAAVIYVVAADGYTAAASNWRQPTSFLGSNYGFRPYFAQALRSGYAEQFALGTVSRKPGLYLARRVEGPNGPLGVVVVKLEFDAVEAAWRAIGEPAFVVDGQGLALITSEPQWRFHTRAPLSPAARQALRTQGQFGEATFDPLPLRARRGDGVARTDIAPADRQIETRLPDVAPGWTLHLLSPAAPADQTADAARWITALVWTLLSAALLWLWVRRRRVHLAALRDRETRLELERRVEARTHELTQANRALSHEVDERQHAETRLRSLQADLVQANKLASLGQIAAGVAHEINQPVAAIRANADNGLLLIARGRAEAAGENLTAIASMTERIGRITDELRAFSRKADGRVEPTLVSEVIDGSVLLTASRSRRQQARLVRKGEAPGLAVLGERVRLEQVLVNLLQNAFEAVEERPDGAVTLTVSETDDAVRIAVADNGPGLAPEVERALFTPFLTTKPRGLGLGLVIAHDIAAGFGGELTAASAPGAGATFTLTLRKAVP
ncbi:ATP-binding protein [Caulobacter radicis]|uniref:C4-dicarboxylate transport sensor protein DctB n=1 Tax=Caulobacter radicis TaxID=2172650 RepID=A0A2T9JPI6_9CAUL|nr:ATP-binding protein [Caulobacter radicis]PVM85612.1 sensor histidine kinase [Caulobacter radicis]